MINRENFIYEDEVQHQKIDDSRCINTLKTESVNINEVNGSSQTHENIQNNNSQSIPQQEKLEELIDKYIFEFKEEDNRNNSYSQEYIDLINSQNMNSEDKINEDDLQKIYFNKSILKNNLEKYIVFSSFKSTLMINSFSIKAIKSNPKSKVQELENNRSSANNNNISAENLQREKELIKFQNIILSHGKIDLLKSFLKLKFKDQQITHQLKNILFSYISSSRYEFVYFSQLLNILIVGNRCGDFHFYKLRMNICFKDSNQRSEKDDEETNLSDDTNNYNLIFNDKPIFILSFTNKICGFKVLEFFEKKNNINSFIEIYFMDLEGRIESYKFS